MSPDRPAHPGSPQPPLFTFEGVTVDGGPDQALLRDVDATVPDQGITVVLGPSGSGKTTLLRLCNRLEVPSSGRVLFREQDVAALDPLTLRRRVGMVFQQPVLFGGTVRDNLRVADRTAAEERYAATLERAHLPPSFLDRRAAELSGGEAQRVCLARALLIGPEVLLMDEPTASLDPAASRALEELARHLAAAGVPVLWVTHDLEQMRRLGDRVLLLIGGRAAFAGSCPELEGTADPAVRRFLSGDAHAGG